MKKIDPIYISNAVAWVGISAAVIYGIKKTGRLTPLFAFAFAPMIRAVATEPTAKNIINYAKEAADGTN